MQLATLPTTRAGQLRIRSRNNHQVPKRSTAAHHRPWTAVDSKHTGSPSASKSAETCQSGCWFKWAYSQHGNRQQAVSSGRRCYSQCLSQQKTGKEILFLEDPSAMGTSMKRGGQLSWQRRERPHWPGSKVGVGVGRYRSVGVAVAFVVGRCRCRCR